MPGTTKFSYNQPYDRFLKSINVIYSLKIQYRNIWSDLSDLPSDTDE